MKRRKPDISVVKNEKFWKAFYYITALAGLIAIVVEISIYRRTIIRLSIPLLIILSAGLVGYVLTRKQYKQIYSLKRDFFPVVQGLISFGFLSCYLFMAANYYLADKNLTEFKFKILEKSSLPGSKGHRDERIPTVCIDYFGMEKELIFGYPETENVNAADSVRLLVKKGGLGFDVLEQYEVMEVASPH